MPTRLPVKPLSRLLPSLVVACCYPLLIGFLLGLLMLAIEKPTQEACASPDSRPKSCIAGNRSDDSPAGSTRSTAGQCTLLSISHPGTSTNGDQYHYDKAYSQLSHRRFLAN